MPEVEEVFRMATQKVRPDPGALERQDHAQRRRNNRRKAGVYVLVACLTLAVVLIAVDALRQERNGIADHPSPVAPTLVHRRLRSGTTTPFAVRPGRLRDVRPLLDGTMITYTPPRTRTVTFQVFVMDADG